MTSNTAAWRRWASALAGLVVVAATSGCSPAPTPTQVGPAPSADSSPSLLGPSAPASQRNPSQSPPPTTTRPVGVALYVDPTTSAAKQAAQWQAQGRTTDAGDINKIASQPSARWLTSASAQNTNIVSSMVRKAAAAHQVPVLVVYFIPHRDCGQFSAGGAASAAAYRDWIRTVAAAIGGQPAIVIVEPDAITHILDGCTSAAQERYSLLADAVAVLKRQGSTRVYLDAGNPNWVKDLPALAAALRQSGVAEADGFALNVANFVTTSDNTAYGQRLSDELGGAHFVIDTSRNGAGPWPGAEVNGGPSWCNPPNRRLGQQPTTHTGLPRVDALLWVKHPGESDGACRTGEPPAGQWWPEYALTLTRQSP